MKKIQKPGVIAEIRKNFTESEAVFVVTQNRMTVANSDDLRRKLRAAGGIYLVCKNTLARLGVQATAFETVKPYLTGQTALVFSKNIADTAKVVQEYASKSDNKISVVCGGYADRLLTADDVVMLAKLPSMNELRAMFVALIQTPARRLATLSQAPASQIARVLGAYSEK
ncbi:MAG: 50S ribosomal protein L10 [Holosporaceae bacterium]|nr:50S ribosomal protein L10 [Holosporaceae bacterium]